MVPTIERHGTLIRFIVLALFLGGAARAVSWAIVGQPPSFQIAAMFLEMSAPLFALWQAKVARDMAG